MDDFYKLEALLIHHDTGSSLRQWHLVVVVALHINRTAYRSRNVCVVEAVEAAENEHGLHVADDYITEWSARDTDGSASIMNA